MGMPTRLSLEEAHERCNVRPLWSVLSGLCPSAWRYHSIVMLDTGGRFFRDVDIWPQKKSHVGKRTPRHRWYCMVFLSSNIGQKATQVKVHKRDML